MSYGARALHSWPQILGSCGFVVDGPSPAFATLCVAPLTNEREPAEVRELPPRVRPIRCQQEARQVEAQCAPGKAGTPCDRRLQALRVVSWIRVQRD